MGAACTSKEKHTEPVRPKHNLEDQRRFEEEGEIEESPSEVQERLQRQTERLRKSQTAGADALKRLQTSQAHAQATRRKTLRVEGAKKNLGLVASVDENSDKRSNISFES